MRRSGLRLIPDLTEDERMMFVRWIDLGCPVTPQDPEREPYGWFLDDLRPTLTMSPSTRIVRDPVTEIRIGAFDYYSGLQPDSLSVVADFEVNGMGPGAELAPLFVEDQSIWTLPLDNAINSSDERTVTVRIRDVGGNWTEITRTFSVAE